MKAGKAFESFNTVWQELVNLLKTLTLGSITIQFVACWSLASCSLCFTICLQQYCYDELFDQQQYVTDQLVFRGKVELALISFYCLNNSTA